MSTALAEPTSRSAAAARRRASTNSAGEAPKASLNRRAKWRGLQWARVGQRLDGQVRREVGRHPGGEVGEAARRAGLEPQGFGILPLAAGAPDVDHQLPRDRQRRGRAQVLLDQRQGQVDAGGDPRRGGEAAVARRRSRPAPAGSSDRAPAISATCRQWVVARRPSIRPLAPRAIRPVQTETSRRVVGRALAAARRRSAPAPAARGCPAPPGTTMVSKSGASASEHSAPNLRPEPLRNRLPVRADADHLDRPASPACGLRERRGAKTSFGPVRSRALTPS